MRKIIILIRKVFSKLKYRWRKLLKVILNYKKFSKKRKILLVIIALVILMIIYLSISLFSVSASRLELANLKQSMEKDGPCHEDCLYFRELAENKVANSLKRDRKLQKDVERYFLDVDDNGLSFKRELLKMISLAYGPGNPPKFIIDYLANKNNDVFLRAEIINLFLAKTNEPSLIEYYFAILNSDENREIKEAVVKTLSGLEDKEDIFTIEQIQMVRELILKDKIPLSLKSDLLFLLNDYFIIFPEETKTALVSIYASSQEPIIKALAADSLNSFSYNEFMAPEISETEWSEYFNN